MLTSHVCVYVQNSRTHDPTFVFLAVEQEIYIRIDMARGHQKIQSQQKAQAKADKMKKSQGSDQKKAAKAALVFQCTVCKVRDSITDRNTVHCRRK